MHMITRCLIFLLAASVVPATVGLDLLDKAVAIVDDDVILASELNRRIQHVAFFNPESQQQDQATLKTQVLEQLIDEQLQYQLAKRARIAVSEAEINTAEQDFNRRLQSLDQNLGEYLQAMNMNGAQMRAQLRTDIAIQKIQRGGLSQRITITPREVDQFLASKAGQDWLQTRFNLGHILLPVRAADNEARLLANANQLHREIANNRVNFKQAAAQFSQGPNAASGGDLGWRTPAELPQLFVQQLSDIQPGDITPVFRSNAGLHILKLYRRTGAEPVFVKRYKVRHILVKSSLLFTDDEAQQKINRLYDALNDGTDFIRLAQTETDDTASKLSGGDLGWSTPGQFVPAFEQVMINTPVGEISQPFKSPFGWHVLRVDDVRTEDMFENVKRNQVRNILRNQRLQDELQIWLLELRERAFIEKIS